MSCAAARRTGRLLLPGLCLLCVLLSIPSPALAQQVTSPWQATISGHPATPPYIIAVDKSRQQLSFFERRSPLRLSRMFFCTTGQAVGDKKVEGDLKTPEGIYFVVQRIGSGLDYIKYGKEAYTLNYPNPIDRIRRKTGYGIWIHGRGEPLIPLQTEGCVSMDNGDLALLGRLLAPGTPVVLTEAFAFVPEDDKILAADAESLRRKVEDWANAWSARSQDYFAFYDQQAYSIAQGEAFSAFRAQKERLFKQLPWIKTTVSDIQALQGPGYWVTWFYQDYEAPNLTTRGVRRLYWTKDDRGEFRIQGMEWLPGLRTSALLASAGALLPPLEQAPPATPPPGWETVGDTSQGSYGVLAAAEGRLPVRPKPPAEPPLVVLATGTGTGDRLDKVPSDAAPATETPPVTTSATDADVPRPESAPGTIIQAGAAVNEPLPRGVLPVNGEAPPDDGGPVASPPLLLAGKDSPNLADHVEDASSGGMAMPSQEAVRLAREERLRARQAAAQTGLRDLGLPPPLPSQRLTESASRGSSGQNAALLSEEKAETQKTSLPQPLLAIPAPEAVRQEPQKAPVSQPAMEVAEPQPAQDKTPATGGQKPAQDEHSVTPVEWLSDEEAASAIMNSVEEWRSAWERGDINAYMAFYAPSARQGGRKNADAIRKQKADLWARVRPASVTLTDARVTVKGDSALVVLRQEYADEQGNGDIGKKTISFVYTGGAWLITQEEWSSLSE